MTSYAVYLKDGSPPRLLRDGFSVWALLFGPFWLLFHAAWIPALLVFTAEILLRVLTPAPVAGAASLGIAVLLGLHGQDLRGWCWARSGWRLAHILAARGHDDAFLRLLNHAPELRSVLAS